MNDKLFTSSSSKNFSLYNKTFTNHLFKPKRKKEKEFQPYFTKSTSSVFYSPITPNLNFIEPLKKCYNNSFYPRTLKLENYKKNFNSSLPGLTQYNFTNVVTESNYDNMINHYKEIYNNQDEINDNEDRSTTINYIFSNNKITKDESEYMKKIIKKNKKRGLTIKSRKDEFSSPKNSLLTLKVNKALMERMNCLMSSTQYDSYTKMYNKLQFDKIKKNIMPKPNIKILQMNQENDKYSNYFKNSDSSNKSINDIIVRNNLIKDTKFYYCKTIEQNNRTPTSRLQASFTKYYNLLYLFGGISSCVLNDLWIFDINTKKWKQQKIKENNYNFKYGHTSILYNDSLYIFGGNINLNKIKYQIEDIIIYNIINKTLKVANFKKEGGKYNKNYFRIPYRRNHICEIIGWNMVVHGGIDIEKEYSNKEDELFFLSNENYDKNDNNVLCDFMMLDLNILKWTKLDNIRYKVRVSKGKKK